MDKKIRIGDVVCIECGKFIRTFEFNGSVEIFGNDKPISSSYCKECYEMKLEELKQMRNKN